MKKLLAVSVVSLVALVLAACSPGGQVVLSYETSDGTTEVARIDPCNVQGVQIVGCETVSVEEGAVITDTVTIEEGAVITDTVTIEEGTVITDTLDMTDTYRGYRLDFPERSIGRVIVEETLVEGPALHQDRDGNVTVVMKNASATFSSGIIWLYKVGDANSVEDEIIFLDNQVKFFNDPSPLWIEPTP